MIASYVDLVWTVFIAMSGFNSGPAGTSML